MVVNISNIKISINAPYKIKNTKDFEHFIVSSEQSEYIVNLIPVDAVSIDEGNLLFDDIEYCVYESNGECYRYFYDSMEDGSIYAKSTFNSDNKTINIEYIPQYMKFFDEDGNLFFHIGLEHVLLQENRLILHASCVDSPYGGILFTGPSGAGKSTQADMWVKYHKSVLINGDRPILSREKDGWYAWGSPYAGSSKVHLNRKCEIKTIVSVVKSSQNEIVQLSGVQAFSRIFCGITVNDWNSKDVEKATNLIIDLMNTVPVYELHCTNTEEAVITLEKALKGEL